MTSSICFVSGVFLYYLCHLSNSPKRFLTIYGFFWIMLEISYIWKKPIKVTGQPPLWKKTLTCTNLALYVCQVHSNFGFSLLLTLTKKTKKSPVIFRQNAETENKQTRQLIFFVFGLFDQKRKMEWTGQ